ncbi:MAG: hypothetical protein HRU46_04610, partial [Verrucomicrobiales bacterium]|nr:hypothetical protein [Verrucomicrobiales bacterium]
GYCIVFGVNVPNLFIEFEVIRLVVQKAINCFDDLLSGGAVDHFSAITFEAWQPNPGARPRRQVKDSNQESQSARGGIGLEIADLLGRWERILPYRNSTYQSAIAIAKNASKSIYRILLSTSG